MPHAVLIGVILVSLPARASTFEPATRTQPQSLRPLIEDLASADAEVRQTAMEALWAPIQNFPIEEWGRVDPNYHRDICNQARPLLGKLERLLNHRDDDVMMTAMMLMTRMGACARSTLPSLQKMFLNEELPGGVRWRALQTACFVTPESLPVAPRLLPTPASALRTIKAIDVEILDNARVTIVAMYGQELGHLLVSSGHTKVEVPHLLRATSRDYPAEVRAIVATTFGVMETDARGAIPTLWRLLKNEELTVRLAAAGAILRIDPDHRNIYRLSQKLQLSDQERDAWEEDASEIVKDRRTESDRLAQAVTRDPDTFLPILIKDVDRGRGPTRRRAIRILGKSGRIAAPAIPGLRRALSHPDCETRWLAAEALSQIAPATPPTPRRLRMHLKNACPFED